jgi:hypothetical protein
MRDASQKSWPWKVEQGAGHSVPSPLVGEGQGGGESQNSDVGVPPTPIPSPQGGGESGYACGEAFPA